MGKIRLNLESLAVQSFATTPAAPQRGTVRAAGATEADADTCWYSCQTCAPDATCGGTCPIDCGSDGWGACGGTAGGCLYTVQPTCYGSACDTWCCTPNTACGEYATCGHNTCAYECTVTCEVGCAE
ncbi:MAG TPA: hypothetical protein VF771_16115 [Longimicrobiaceae bacterium]